MPRSRRLSPGQGARGGGGLHALADILHGIFGGVEANPEFGTQGPTPNGTPLGGQPYKAKTIFDRARASEMNALYGSDEFAAENDVSRMLRGAGGMTEELTRREEAKKKLDLQYRPEFDRLDVDKDRQQGNNAMLNLQRILANPENEANYQAQNTPLQMGRLNAEAQQGKTVADTGNILSGIAGEEALATKGRRLALAPKRLDYESAQLDTNQRLLPIREDAEIDEYANKKKLGDLRLGIEGVVPVNDGLFDILQRGYIVPPPTSFTDEMMRKEQGLPPQQYPMANPRMGDADEVIINGVKIDAKKFPQGYAAATQMQNNVAVTQPDAVAQPPAIQGPPAPVYRKLDTAPYASQVSGLPTQQDVAKVLQELILRIAPPGSLYR